MTFKYLNAPLITCEKKEWHNLMYPSCSPPTHPIDDQSGIDRVYRVFLSTFQPEGVGRGGITCFRCIKSRLYTHHLSNVGDFVDFLVPFRIIKETLRSVSVLKRKLKIRENGFILAQTKIFYFDSFYIKSQMRLNLMMYVRAFLEYTEKIVTFVY